MPRNQAVTLDSTNSREHELRVAEQEVSSDEVQLAKEIARLESAAGEILARLQQVKAAAAQAQLSGVREPQFAELHKRVHAATVERLDVSAYQEEAFAARLQAVEARRRAAESTRAAVHTYASNLSRLSSQLTADEAAMAQFEANARAAEAQRRAAAQPVDPATIPGAAPVPPRTAPAAAPQPAPVAQIAKPQGRRAQSRVRMQAAIDLHSESNFFTGFSTNISEGGLFVATVSTVPIGTEVDLSFTLPGGRKVSIHGVVRWTREVNDQTPEIFPGVGVQFVNLDPQTASAIHEFVSAREPLFYPE